MNLSKVKQAAGGVGGISFPSLLSNISWVPGNKLGQYLEENGDRLWQGARDEDQKKKMDRGLLSYSVYRGSLYTYLSSFILTPSSTKKPVIVLTIICL